MNLHTPHGDPFRNALPRRRFLKHMAAAGAGVGAWTALPQVHGDTLSLDASPPVLPDYTGPNVVIVRFGGGVRRRETIDPDHTYAPFFCHELTKRGTLFRNMEIDSLEGVETSHGQGTLYILTGKYDKYKDVQGKFLGERFESKVPTVFEYLRKYYAVPDHQTLIVNGEDRTNEEFYTFSNHHLFGVHYRSNVLSLYRFKTYLLRRQIENGRWQGKELESKRKELTKLESVDYRKSERDGQPRAIEDFWARWKQFYGESGLVNPRGDRLLTELTIRALKELRPKLIMVNYNDPDYVHWGNMTHYTRGVSIIDEGLRDLVAAVEADEQYRDNTIFVIVPDCGRDSNPLAAVPCQHHFGSRSSHEIFCLLFGPGIARGAVVDTLSQQISVATTVGHLMKFKSEFTEGPVLEQAFA